MPAGPGRSRRDRNRFLPLLTALLVFYHMQGLALADTLRAGNKTFVGTVSRLGTAGITITLCDGTRVERTWRIGMTLRMDASCSDAGGDVAAGRMDCTKRNGMSFEVAFRQGLTMLANEVSVGPDGVVHLASDQQVAHGPFGDVTSIAAFDGCSVADDMHPPSNFCVEGRQWAVNFSYDAPLPNRIFTKGFSFYLETYPAIDDHALATMRETIRGSFGSAINVWASSLWRKRDLLDPKLAALLDGMASHSEGGYTLFMPPQVIALTCPQSATFVVRAFIGAPGPFGRPPQTEILAAVAANPGRTILLNYADYPCWENALFSHVVSEQTGCVNLVSILLHELGHAFGLGHQEDEINSIMNPVIIVTKPSEEDLKRLADKLMEAINGRLAGDIPFVDDGVAVRLR